MERNMKIVLSVEFERVVSRGATEEGSNFFVFFLDVLLIFNVVKDNKCLDGRIFVMNRSLPLEFAQNLLLNFLLKIIQFITDFLEFLTNINIKGLCS